MSDKGMFEFEEDDIVRLESSGNSKSRSGWVNVGVHAVHIQLTEDGHLVVAVNARTNEDGALGTVTVTREKSVQAGGVDPDE